jgi:hypothetical protein
MDNIGYRLTDWIFFFNPKNKEDLKRILSAEKNKELSEEFITWKLITVFLPLIPFVLVLVLNISTNTDSSNLFFSFVNNGSLPIISFGIISSGMPYLLERLSEFPEYHLIRRRVMAVSLFFLFLSAALYIFQTLYLFNVKINLITNIASLFFSIYVLSFSGSIGYKMFILQSKNIPPYDEGVKEDVKGLRNALDDLD